MTTARLSATRPLPPETGVEAVETWLTACCSRWELPAGAARRWASAVGRELPRDERVELYVEYDPVTSLATVELWRSGRVVFGIDDWLGLW